MMIAISPLLVLVFAVTIPMSILFTRYMTKRVRPLFRKRSMMLGELNGFVEEVIFRGLLFRALARDSVNMAIAVSSITFGLGHLLNLVNGSGAGLAENLFQVTGAIAIGFLFVILFHRGGSLWPCVIAHAAINIASAFCE